MQAQRWLRWKPDHPARHRPGTSRADQGHGYQMERPTGRTIWYPWPWPASPSGGSTADGMIRWAGYARSARNTRSRANRRAISVQLTRVTRGQPRPLRTGFLPSSATQRAAIDVVPKLTARVRFPSPAPKLFLRPSLHDLPPEALRASVFQTVPPGGLRSLRPPGQPRSLRSPSARPLPGYAVGWLMPAPSGPR